MPCRRKAVTGVLFLVQFNNFDQTTRFYWSYMLLLKFSILMHSCPLHSNGDLLKNYMQMYSYKYILPMVWLFTGVNAF